MSSRNREPPPASPRWDLPLAEATLAFLDLEMTGLNPALHRVVEICIVCVRGDHEVERLESYVRPEPLPEKVGNEHVHGIGRDALTSAPTFGELAPRVRALLDGAVMIAHGARWDAAFLSAEMGRLEHAWRPAHHIDTLALARRLLTSDNYRLSTLASGLGIQNDQPHRAGSDVAVTRQLFSHLVETIAATESRTLTPRLLWERCVGKMPIADGVLDAAAEAAESGLVMSVHYRGARRGAQKLEFVVTDVRTDLDPPVVLGYLHPTRGRRELRVDRILSIDPLAK